MSEITQKQYAALLDAKVRGGLIRQPKGWLGAPHRVHSVQTVESLIKRKLLSEAAIITEVGCQVAGLRN